MADGRRRSSSGSGARRIGCRPLRSSSGRCFGAPQGRLSLSDKRRRLCFNWLQTLHHGRGARQSAMQVTGSVACQVPGGEPVGAASLEAQDAVPEGDVDVVADMLQGRECPKGRGAMREHGPGGQARAGPAGRPHPGAQVFPGLTSPLVSVLEHLVEQRPGNGRC